MFVNILSHYLELIHARCTTWSTMGRRGVYLLLWSPVIAGELFKKVKSKSLVLETPMPILSWFLVTLRLTRHSLTVYIYEIFNDILSFPTHCCSTVTLGYRTHLYYPWCNTPTLRTTPVRIPQGIIYTNLNGENNIQKLNTGPETPFSLPLLSQK